MDMERYVLDRLSSLDYADIGGVPCLMTQHGEDRGLPYLAFHFERSQAGVEKSVRRQIACPIALGFIGDKEIRVYAIHPHTFLWEDRGVVAKGKEAVKEWTDRLVAFLTERHEDMSGPSDPRLRRFLGL